MNQVVAEISECGLGNGEEITSQPTSKYKISQSKIILSENNRF